MKFISTSAICALLAVSSAMELTQQAPRRPIEYVPESVDQTTTTPTTTSTTASTPSPKKPVGCRRDMSFVPKPAAQTTTTTQPREKSVDIYGLVSAAYTYGQVSRLFAHLETLSSEEMVTALGKDYRLYYDGCARHTTIKQLASTPELKARYEAPTAAPKAVVAETPRKAEETSTWSTSATPLSSPSMPF